MTTTYEDLGVRRVINAAAAQTMLGGALMPEPVLAAMQEAAGGSVYLPELHDRVGERLAHLTHNEAACVCCGAAAGILVAVAACMTGEDVTRAEALPAADAIERREVVVFRAHDNGFLSSVTESGAEVVLIDGNEEALRTALTPRTAAVLWFAGDFWGDNALPLPETITIAHEQGVPVIVDAADQIPPLANLWEYTRDEEADLAIFSGGKGLRGPQASGLIVGRPDLIRACRANSGPQHSIGRPAKVGKEEMLGLLAAIEWSFAHRESDVTAGYEAVVARWLEGLRGFPGVEVAHTPRSHSGQPIPRAIVTFAAPERRDAVRAALWEMNPRVAVLPEGERAIGLNPQLLMPDQPPLVLAAVREAILATQ
ncbi:MAG: DegT/DnrJ/EryC1/StrS family aminotransferase [Thermomicrobiales bacterium]